MRCGVVETYYACGECYGRAFDRVFRDSVGHRAGAINKSVFQQI
jgi:hypothetical protein